MLRHSVPKAQPKFGDIMIDKYNANKITSTCQGKQKSK